MPDQIMIGPQLANDGAVVNMRGDNYGAQMVLEMGGKYMEWVRRGYVYAARSGAAAAIPVNTTLTNGPTLWNTASSGKLVVPLKVLFSAATLGTQVIDGFTLHGIPSTGDAAATGLPIAAFTNVAPNSCLIGSSKACNTKFANAAVTLTNTAPTAIMDLGMGQWLNGTSAYGAPYTLSFEFDGSIVMPPGTAIAIGAATAATSATYWTTILFAEIPYTIINA